MVTGAVTWRRGPSFRVRVGALGMACAMAPLYFVDSVPLMGLLLLIGGVAIAPTMIAGHDPDPGQRAAGPADRGHGDHADRARRRRGPGRRHRGLRRRPHGASAAYLVSLAAGVLAAASLRQPSPGSRAADRPASARADAGDHRRARDRLAQLVRPRDASARPGAPRPADPGDVVAEVRRALETRSTGQDGRHRPQLHRDRARRRPPCSGPTA